MPSSLTTEQSPVAGPCHWACQMCDCAGEECDGTICHGFDAD